MYLEQETVFLSGKYKNAHGERGEQKKGKKHWGFVFIIYLLSSLFIVDLNYYILS